MTDAPIGAAPPAEDNLVFLRIVATVTDLALFSTSIVVGSILISVCMDFAPLAFVPTLVLGLYDSSPLIGTLLVLGVGILFYSPGSRMLGLSVESSDGACLSLIRQLWRMVLKYLWLLLGILVILPLNLIPIHKGETTPMLFTTTALPILLGGIVMWWVGGSGRSVYDLTSGTIIVKTRPVDSAKLGWTWLVLWIPVTFQVYLFLMLSALADMPVFTPDGDPDTWGLNEWEIESFYETRNQRRNLGRAETLTTYSVNVLGVTLLTYAVFGWRHRPGRRSSPGDAALSRRDEPADCQVRPMTDSPTGTESLAANRLVLRRILATVTNLAMVSTSILVGAILIDLIGQQFHTAQSFDRNQSIPVVSLAILAVSLMILDSCNPYIVDFMKFIRSNPGCRMLGLSVKSADGGDLSAIRYLWRMVLKYLWVLLGVLVCLPPFMRPVSEGLALLASTPGLPILFAGFALWWVGGSGRSVYDLGAGTVVVPSHPVDHARLRKTWLILGIPVILQIAALYYTFVLGQGLGFPWDIREYRVSARDVWRNKPFAEELTEYSLAVLVLTGISYMVSGRRHLPGRKASNCGPEPAAGSETVEGDGGGAGGGQRGDPSQEPFSPQS